MRHVPSRCTDDVCGGDRRLRHPQRARRFEDLGAAILQEPRVREIVGMILVGDANRREAPRILHVRIERDVVRLDGQRGAVAVRPACCGETPSGAPCNALPHDGPSVAVRIAHVVGCGPMRASSPPPP